eukprot:9500353-Pyramimonas_sp.AAC.1
MIVREGKNFARAPRIIATPFGLRSSRAVTAPSWKGRGGGARQSKGRGKGRGGREIREGSNGRKPGCAQAKPTLRAETVVRSFGWPCGR